MATVVAAWTRLIVDHAAAEGCDVPAALAKGGLAADALPAERDARVPAQVDERVWACLDRALGDPDLGVHVSERRTDTAAFGVVGYLARSAATVGEALATAWRYQRLVKDYARVELRRERSGATVIDLPARGTGWRRSVAEVILANYLAMSRAWSGAPALAPREVRFTHARPADRRELDRFFGCAVRFDQPDTAIVFGRDDLERPLLTAEAELLAYLEPFARARLDALPAATLAGEVRAVVLELLARGEPSAAVIARRLGTSVRSLQRGLAAERVSLRAVVDATRQAAAVELLREGRRSEEIAERLGFSDPRAFRRAFRRWTGVAPSEARSVPGLARPVLVRAG